MPDSAVSTPGHHKNPASSSDGRRVILHDYERSSAAYRIRIALALKGIAYEKVKVDLLSGEQKGDAYRAINPQMTVPMLEIDGLALTQTLAILDYLDRQYPDPPLLPADPAARARALSMAMLVIADIHPVQNLRILKYLDETLGHGPDIRPRWAAHWITTGLTALEAMASEHASQSGPDTLYLAGDQPGLPDLCLIPQMVNARRFGVDLALFPRLIAIDNRARTHPAFVAAAPPPA